MKKLLFYLNMMGKIYLYGFVLQLFFMNILYAENSNAQGTKDIKKVMVNLSFEDAPLHEVFSTLKRETDFSFVFDKKVIGEHAPVNLSVINQSLEEVLLSLSASHRLTFQQLNDRISVKNMEEGSIANPISSEVTITGSVTDNDGEPLPGATITIEGTQSGVTTNEEGNYSITVPEDATLVFSYIGFVQRRVKVENQSIINIVLELDESSLDEVIVIGYGEQRRANILGAVESVTTEELVDIPAANMSSLLQGRMAGVNVGGPTGRPGTPSSFNIRGTGTWNNEPPLFVIDGFIRDQAAFDVLDPTEIESVSVLKDAAAAVYGARGAGGVVLIQTKRGKEGKARISYSGSVGLADATMFTDMLSAYDQGRLINNQLRTQFPDTYMDQPGYFTQDELGMFQNYDFNWMDMAWKSSMITRHTVNVSGGSDKVRYFGGASYYNEDANLPGTDLNKYSLRMGIDADITDGLTASLTLSGDMRNDTRPFNRNDNPNSLEMIFRELVRTPRWIPPYIDGLPVGQNGTIEYHPIELGRVDSYASSQGSNLVINAALDYQVPMIQGLRLRLAYNQSTTNRYGKQLRRDYDLWNFETAGGNNHLITDQVIDSYRINNQERIQEDHTFAKNYQLNSSIAYSRQFGDHDIDALLVYELAENESNSFNALRLIQVIPGYDVQPGFSSANMETGGGMANGARMGYVGRLNYSYAGKYLLESAFRYEGSVNFPPQSRWGLFPSVALGWRMSEEPFFYNNIRFINDMKLRISGGILGNDDIAGREWQYSYGQAGGAYLGGNSITNGLNPRLSGLIMTGQTWEKTRFFNGGIDFGLTNGLRFALDGFYRYTFDILGSRASALPANVGVNNMPAENYGRMEAWGFDGSVNYQGYAGKDFSYNLGLVTGWNANKVLEIAQNQAVLGTWRDEIGRMRGGQDGLIALGIIRTQEQLDRIMEENPDLTIFGRTPELGMMMYQDVGGPDYSNEPDGVIDDNDLRMIAPAVASIGFSLNLGASYKGLSISTQLGMSGIGTKVFYEQVAYRLPYPGTNDRLLNVPAFWADHWTPETPDAAFPRPYEYGGHHRRSTFWMSNGTTMNLNILNVSYSLPASLVERHRLPQVRIYFTGRNLWRIINPFDYKDPSVSNFDNYPTLRTFNFGLNINI